MARPRVLCLPLLPAATSWPLPPRMKRGGGGSPPAAPWACINPLVPVCCQVPQRTSPTGPKSTPNPARLSNVPSSILRKNSPAARNGGTEADAQILELNQQVGRAHAHCCQHLAAGRTRGCPGLGGRGWS